MRPRSSAASWGFPGRGVLWRGHRGQSRGFGGLYGGLIRQPSDQELVLDLHDRGKLHLLPEFHEAHHRDTDMAATISPNRMGTRTGGTSHDLIRSLNAIWRSFQKKSLASARLPSSQSGGLLLLGPPDVPLDIALVRLSGGLGLARRAGLGGFIGALLLIGHKVLVWPDHKNYF